VAEKKKNPENFRISMKKESSDLRCELLAASEHIT
jgi:hypothetical protein